MAARAGVWIDHKQAIVVLVTEAGPEIKKVAFDLGKPDRSAGSPRTKKNTRRTISLRRTGKSERSRMTGKTTTTM